DAQHAARERDTVQPAGHAQRSAQLGGPGAQLVVGHAAAPPAHRGESGQRLERADQDGRRKPHGFRHGIQAPVHAVGEVDVRCAGCPERDRLLVGTALFRRGALASAAAATTAATATTTLTTLAPPVSSIGVVASRAPPPAAATTTPTAPSLPSLPSSAASALTPIL